MTNPTNTAPAVVPVPTRGVRETANRLAAQLPGLGGGEARLDFGAVEYIESRELGALVVLNRKVREAGGRLALVNVRPFVAGVLEVTRLDTILDVRRAA
jgi:anti-anti-sigma factor